MLINTVLQFCNKCFLYFERIFFFGGGDKENKMSGFKKYLLIDCCSKGTSKLKKNPRQLLMRLNELHKNAISLVKIGRC